MGAIIEQQRRGALARSEKLNEVIKKLIPLLNIRVEFIEEGQISEVVYADNNVLFKLPRDASGGGGGGLPPGFEEETLDVVEDDNTPGTRIFLTKEP